MKTLRWIKEVLQKKILYLLIILIIQAAISIGSVGYAVIFKGLMDAAVGGSMIRLRNWILYFIILVIIQTTMGAVNRFFSELSRADIENALKERLYTAIMNRRYDQVTAMHSGEWMNRFTSDVMIVADGITQIIPGAVSMLVRIVCAVALLIHFCWIFGCIIVPGAILFLIVSAGFRKILKKRHKYVQETDGRLRIALQESLSALLVVKAFSKERNMLEQMKSLMNEHKSARLKKNAFSNLCNTGYVAVMNAAYIVGTAIGGYGIILGTMSYGTLIAIVQLIGQIQTPLSNITGYVPQFYSMLASAERLKEIEQYDKDIASESLKSTEEIRQIYQTEFKEIVFKDVSFAYKYQLENKFINKQVFEHLNVGICKKDCIALTGPSGCGKSTFLKLIMKLYTVDEGNIIVKGLTGEKELSAAWRHLYAYVPQGNQLMAGTIRNIITFGEADCKEESRIWKALQIADAEGFVRNLKNGVDTYLGERGAGLSEGQMQRIAIARAVYAQAPVLLLDEATSALDEETEYRVLKNIQTMTDKTILIVTHRRTVLAICNAELHFSDDEIVIKRLR